MLLMSLHCIFVSCLVWFLSSVSYPNVMKKLYITKLYNQICLVESLVKCLEVWKISVPLQSKTMVKHNKTQQI